MDKRPARIQAMFGAIADRYDALNHGLSLDRDRGWRRAAVAAIGPAAGERVLDLCCGTGDLALEIAAGVARPALVVGSDFAEPMLRIARRKARAVRVPLLAADSLRLPFPSATFDAATVAFGIRNVASLSGGLAEMRRVLRDGGRAVILEFNRPRNPIVRIVYETYFHLVLPLAGNLVSGSRNAAYNYLPRSVLHFPKARALAGLMEDAGFRDVSFRTLDLGIVTIHSGTR
jgi:demethylmenaquinone methyltransferase/2-methoxy-6-polyprenyl-1,4-benzoquinol methylase